jgi:hypothetical protein
MDRQEENASFFYAATPAPMDAKRQKVDEEEEEAPSKRDDAEAAQVLTLSDSEDHPTLAVAEAPPVDEDKRLLDSLVDDEFAVVLTGGGGGNTTLLPDETNSKKDGLLPAMRFSGQSSNATTSSGIRSTPEQEEAMRVMGVTPENYAQLMNPQGITAGRRPNAFELDIDAQDHPKWREPGSIQSDFFNYGLLESTWREYAARQVALRLYRLKKLDDKNAEV